MVAMYEFAIPSPAASGRDPAHLARWKVAQIIGANVGQGIARQITAPAPTIARSERTSASLYWWLTLNGTALAR